jgi:hypothetical protein
MSCELREKAAGYRLLASGKKDNMIMIYSCEKEKRLPAASNWLQEERNFRLTDAI